MARAFDGNGDDLVCDGPITWPGNTGTIFVNIKPRGWSSGAGPTHAFWAYGWTAGTTRALLHYLRNNDGKAYVGWVGDAAHGGEQRIIVPDTGLFADGVWSNHAYTWDANADRAAFLVNGVVRGTRTTALAPPQLSGAPTSAVTIGNASAAATTSALASLAFFGRWDRVLSDVELAQLAAGAHPLDIPRGLVECIDLGAATPERDLQSSATYTPTGTRVDDDPWPSPTFVHALALRFEPIMLFHPDEAFLPVDPKWYLERSSLWPAVAPFTAKASWGEGPGGAFPHAPTLARGSVAALAGDAAGGTRWLGEPGKDFGVGFAPDREAPPPPTEHFLDFASWEPATPPPNEVTATSENRHPALDPAAYAGPLSGSKPWYYVEYLDNDALVAYARARSTSGLDLDTAVVSNPAFDHPRVLLYHFLYPLHPEALENCEAAGEGQSFATYAGEWSCVALLLDRGDVPRFIGVTSRNIGKPSAVPTEDARVGMTAFPWTAAQPVAGPDNAQHPRIFVSRGTHGNYLSAGSFTLTPFMGGNDYSRGSCGVVESLDDAVAGDVVIPGIPSDMTPTWVLVVKFGIIVLIPWGLFEISDDHFGTGDELTEPSTATDVTGSTVFRVIRPAGLAFPEAASASSVEDWNARRQAAADGRVYDTVVSRPAQPWWAPRRNLPSRNEGAGWFGRWGPRVTHDPFNRRAGGHCPDFARQFLESVAIALNA